jgi:hypothetical protein
MMTWIVFTLAMVGQAHGSSCIPQAKIEALNGEFKCVDLGRMSGGQLQNNCHTQGAAWDERDQSLTVSCMDLEDSTKAHLLHYTNISLQPAVTTMQVGSELRHPSGIQYLDETLAVAFAPKAHRGPSEVRFFERDSKNGLVPSQLKSLVHSTHLGAVAYAKFSDIEMLIGCGWDCADWAVWTRSDQQPFKLQIEGNPNESVDPSGLDKKIGAYNSLHLSRRCEDSKPILFASAGPWLDVWEISGRFKIKKIAKKKFSVPSTSNLFHEGMTLTTEGHVLATPHDYENCGSLKCMPSAYLCSAAGGTKTGPGPH